MWVSYQRAFINWSTSNFALKWHSSRQIFEIKLPQDPHDDPEKTKRGRINWENAKYSAPPVKYLLTVDLSPREFLSFMLKTALLYRMCHPYAEISSAIFLISLELPAIIFIDDPSRYPFAVSRPALPHSDRLIKKVYIARSVFYGLRKKTLWNDLERPCLL